MQLRNEHTYKRDQNYSDLCFFICVLCSVQETLNFSIGDISVLFLGHTGIPKFHYQLLFFQKVGFLKQSCWKVGKTYFILIILQRTKHRANKTLAAIRKHTESRRLFDCWILQLSDPNFCTKTSVLLFIVRPRLRVTKNTVRLRPNAFGILQSLVERYYIDFMMEEVVGNEDFGFCNVAIPKSKCQHEDLVQTSGIELWTLIVQLLTLWKRVKI